MVTISSRRRALALGGTGFALGIGGCAGDDLPQGPANGAAAGTALLTPWLTINGGWRLDAQAPVAARAAGPRLNFVQPVGVAAQGDALLVADAGARTLWRLDRSRDAMASFAPFTGAGAEQGASLQLGNDFSAW